MAAVCRHMRQLSRLRGLGLSRISPSPSSSSFQTSTIFDPYFSPSLSTTRSFSQLVKSNGKHLFLVDTLALVRRLEAQGVPSKQAEAITAAITEVLNDSLENVSQALVSKGEMQKTEMIQESNLSKFKSEVQSSQTPFEFRALEIFLEAICSFLDARAADLEMDTYPTLDELTNKISSRNLEKVRKLKSAMTRLTARVQKVKESIEHLMDDDEDMDDLYLSRKLKEGTSSPISQSGVANNWNIVSSPSTKSKSLATLLRDENDVEELEMLLEAYYMQIEATFSRLSTLRGYIDDTEDYINIQIDNHRNQLIQLELFLNAAELCLAFYSVVTGIFGMNLQYDWQNGHAYMFKWVVIFTGFFCISLYLIIVAYARKKGLVGS